MSDSNKKIAPPWGADFAISKWGNGPFLRFGAWHPDEYSQIFYGDPKFTHEPGVSVYPTFWNEGKRKWAVDCSYQPVCTDNASSNYSSAAAGHVDIFLVSGKIVGRGTDREPLIREVELIKKLRCNQVYVPYYNYDVPEHCNPSSHDKLIINNCQNLWGQYYRKPTKKNLKAVFAHLEVMKSSKSEKVKKERARCLRAANKEVKRYDGCKE